MSNAFRVGTVITTNTTTTVLSSIGNLTQTEGVLGRIVIGASSTAGIVTVYDNTSASGSPVAQLAVSANQPLCAILDIQLERGLTVVTASFTSPNVTVIYK